ncbi:MAG: IS110 family RNA-guided transposase [Planctomycetota bacterium]|jgi:transposase
MIHAGADVHIRNSLLNVKDENGQVLACGRCGNTMLELSGFLAPIERRCKATGEPIRVVMESTGNSRAMQRLLTQYGREAGIDLTAEVLHARKLRVIAESVNKCDRVDADILTELSRSNLKLPTCYMPDDEEFALREHLRARNDLVKIRTMLKNRAHAILHRRGILTPKVDLFGRTGGRFLDDLALDQAGQDTLQRFRALIDRLDEEIKDSTAAIRSLMREPRWANPAAVLQTIPGIALITSMTILAELGKLTRFHSRAAVANYAGLVPRHRDSDGKRWSGRITCRGSAHLRGVLIEAAWIAAPRVPVYQALFQRIERKKNRKTAVVAVARRMLEDAWMLLIKDEVFRYVPVPVGHARGERTCSLADPEHRELRSRAPQAASSVAG